MIMKNRLKDFISVGKAMNVGRIARKSRKIQGIAMIAVAVFIAGCPGDTGDLIGVQGRSPWLHPQPPGMVYVRTGTFHTGQGTQDIFQSYLEPNKQMTISGFWMDETEITNNEYRQFVSYVIDSMSRSVLDQAIPDGVLRVLMNKSQEPSEGVALFVSRDNGDPMDDYYDPNAVDNNGDPIKYINFNEPLDPKYKSKN